jgi:deoxyribodipyrimidine photolyase-related protein
MKKEINIGMVFPHQLFLPQPLLKENTKVILLEDHLFFGDEHETKDFHFQKLVLHRASMKAYAKRLLKDGVQVEYVEYKNARLTDVFGKAKGQKTQKILIHEVHDYELEKRLQKCAKEFGIEICFLEAPDFLNTKADNEMFFRKDKKRFLHGDFYKQQRKRLGILLDEKGEPKGGRWSFDAENRKKLHKDLIGDIPPLPTIDQNTPEIVEAKHYIQKNFPNAFGDHKSTFLYPFDHESAISWLDCFLHKRFAMFGPYEDAICAQEPFQFHSVLTPMLNIGLLTPRQIVSKTLQYSEKHEIPMESQEGFFRQIIGWREFMRGSYEAMGSTLRTKNIWQHQNPMPKGFYNASTGLDPVDTTIKQILQTGYCHHIERLMILGNSMFLLEIHPNAIYRWFMELFVDSYDWVMVPNVYAMSQNAPGDLITTKPYFSGSNYIIKMSHYKKGGWSEIWDALYWSFLQKKKEELKNNPRWSFQVRQAEKMKEEKIAQHKKISEVFKKSIL